jgi:hypothetical protein
MAHKDVFGRELKVGQKCLYVNHVRHHAGIYPTTIKGFTPKSVKIIHKRWSWKENNITIVTPSSLIVLSEEGINWDAVNG